MRTSTSQSRGDQRGTAMVEAVLAIPVFVLLLAGVVYVHGIYTGKIRAMADARAFAWTYATRSCQAAPTPEQLGIKDSSSAAPNGTVSADGTDVPGQLAQSGNAISSTGTAIDGSPVVQDVEAGHIGGANGTRGMAVGQSHVQMHASSVLGAVPTAATATVAVMCNEVPADGTPQGFITAAKDLARW